MVKTPQMHKTPETPLTPLAPLKLDLFDRRLLYEIDANARQPASRLARRAGVSQQVADYRLKRLENSGLLRRLVTLVEYRRFGYSNHSLMIRFQNTDQRKMTEINNFFMKHQNVNGLFVMNGRWDLFVSISVRNLFELNEVVSEIEAKYAPFIRETAKASHMGRRYFYRQYLVPEKERREQSYTPITGGDVRSIQPYDLSEEEAAILLALDQDARASAVDIARSTGLSPDSVHAKLKTLSSERVIVGTHALLNHSLLGRSFCRLFLKTHSLGREREAKLVEFVSSNSAVFAFMKAFGAWDYNIELEVASDKEFSDFSLALRNEFGDVIVEYEPLISCELAKFHIVPLDLMKIFK